jgi:8-oxo-dGTP pyrophosphatase MutT (NUDIX family)
LTDRFLRAHAREQLSNYLRVFANEQVGLASLTAQLCEDGGDVFSRLNMRGHITTSGLVYDPKADLVLIIHHKIYDRWLPPGGHHEGIVNLSFSAMREVLEETGIHCLARGLNSLAGDMPLDIDSHVIPANPQKGEGEHLHHDFIYLFSAASQQLPQPQLEEVKAVKWLSRRKFAKLSGERFGRLGKKLVALRLGRFDQPKPVRRSSKPAQAT